MKVKGRIRGPFAASAHCRPAFVSAVTESERIRWYPKDGELCLGRMKPGETLVEVRSDTDVQIVRVSWV